MTLESVNAIVTGATGGIGQAIVSMLLANRAAKVGVLGRDQEKVMAVIEEVGGHGFGDQTVPLVADITDPHATEKAVDSFTNAAGPLQILVNNAGVVFDGALVSFAGGKAAPYPMESWDATLRTNLTGTFLCTQLAVAQMMAGATGGVVVNISSTSRQGAAGQAAYSCTKGGIVSMTLSLAQELTPMGIRCVAVAPGLVEIGMGMSMSEGHRKRLLRRIPAGRMAHPDEVAHAVRFCIENDYFNGAVLDLHGGMQ